MKHTKKALLTSALSMLLCLSMLIGSTFAWFTDSVTSGKNKIVAGNLDVELYHTNASVAAKEKVTKDTDLFVNADGSAINWEPGAAAYENFRVENAGSLALKFRLAMNVFDKNTVTVDGTAYSLADVIKVAVLDHAFEGERTELSAMDFTDGLEAFEKIGALEPNAGDKSSAEFAVVLYWAPTANDDIYNLKNGKTSSDSEPLWIEIGIDLQAAQTPFEKDSFDENYDATAEFPDAAFAIGPSSFTAEPVDGEQTVLGNDAVSLTAPNGALTAGNEIVFEVTPNSDVAEGVTVASDEKSVSYDIGLYTKADHTEVHPKSAVTVKLYIGKNLTDVSVYHDGELMEAGVSYDHETGYLTFTTSDFSPFDIIYRITLAEFTNANGTTLYGTLSDMSNAMNTAEAGDVMKLVRDIDVDSLTYYESLTFTTSTAYNGNAVFQRLFKGTFDGNGYTVTMPSDCESGWIFLDVVDGATVKNLNVVLNGGCTGVARSANEVTFDSVTVKGNATFSNNGGVFLIYAVKSATPPVFRNCVSEVNIKGTGYNAVFVGYPLATGLTFVNCYNRGSIFCDQAAMFFANPAGVEKTSRVFTITDCKNEGLVHSINNTDYGKRNLFAAVASGNMIGENTTVVINGTTYTGAEAVDLDTEALGLGNPIEISKEDPRLEVRYEGNDFIIVPASELDVDHYVLEYDTYAHTDALGSTSRKFISWTFSAQKGGEPVTAALKRYDFVDKEWIKSNPNAVKGELEGYTTYTIGGRTYYELPDLDHCFYKSHEPNPGDNCTVKAYDKYGNLLTSVGFAITSGEKTSKK